MASLQMERTRAAERSGTFLKAKLEAPGDPIRDVVVRNMSESGALIEGRDLPALGMVVLARGEMRAEARIVRSEGRQRGLHFREAVQLPGWLPHLALRDIVAASEDRRRLDEAGTTPNPRSEALTPLRNQPIHARIAEELALLDRQFGQILDGFAEDPAIVMRHPKALTRLEAAQQLMRGLGDILKADDPAAEARKLSAEEARRRLLRT